MLITWVLFILIDGVIVGIVGNDIINQLLTRAILLFYARFLKVLK